MMTTDPDFVPMRLGQVRGVSAERDNRTFVVVLTAEGSDQRLPILIGPAEAVTLSARLNGTEFPRPMAPQFAASLVAALGGQVRQVQIDQLVTVPTGTAYGATVHVVGPAGPAQVDARSSDALNLAALVSAPILVAPEVLADAEQRLAANTAEARLLRLALAID
jgi:bifunctional DNase/RNase